MHLVRVSAGCGAALLILLSRPAGAAVPVRLVAGTYRQIDTVTKKPLPVGNQLVIIPGKTGRLGFSVNAVRQSDTSEGFVAGVLGTVLPATWTRASSSGNCRITFEGVPSGLRVIQDAGFGDCGFEAGLSASGTYGLVPEKPPKT